MILADKIIRLRKKNGWSQEELANKMNVSRQAVSKWEGAQAIPDLEKILQMSTLFGVTTDYLLKDEIEAEEFVDTDVSPEVRRVSLDEANSYVEHRRWASFRIAFATYLCILSPIMLLLLGAASDEWSNTVSEALASIVGLVSLFACVGAAVAIYIYCGFKNDAYGFLDKSSSFELEYGVLGVVKEKQKAFRRKYVRSNIIATCLCIFSPLPLIVSAFSNADFFIVSMLCLMLVIVGAGVSIFIVAGVQNASMQKLLCEGDYTKEKKQSNALAETVDSVYWGILVATYLAWSFLSGDWHITWVVFPVGAILTPAVNAICKVIADRKGK